MTTGLSEVVEPGVPSENLLGEAAYLIETTNEAAAERGLGALLQNLNRTVSSLTDPQGGAGEPQSEQQIPRRSRRYPLRLLSRRERALCGQRRLRAYCHQRRRDDAGADGAAQRAGETTFFRTCRTARRRIPTRTTKLPLRAWETSSAASSKLPPGWAARRGSNFEAVEAASDAAEGISGASSLPA